MTGTSEPESKTSPKGSSSSPGTVLEAAFVDPAYNWPPEDGVGRNAIELQASTNLLEKVESSATTDTEEDDLKYPEPPRIKNKKKVITETETTTTTRCGVFRCCKSQDTVVVNTHTVRVEDEAEKARLKAEYLQKVEEVKGKRKERDQRLKSRRKSRVDEKYHRVPEGVLVYRLDTASHEISLCSAPNSNTNMDKLLCEMVIVDAFPSRSSSRRGIWLKGKDGTSHELIACDQRTATAWMEALTLMLGKRTAGLTSGIWKKDKDTNQIEEKYLNLAAYSNNLIKTGALPSNKKKGKDRSTKVGGIYYSVTKQHEEGEVIDEEALESIAKRRAVIKDSWDFYRMICSLLRDRRKYDEAFRRLQVDPVYPYLNSMTGLNDPGDDAYASEDKIVMQKDLPEYQSMTRTEVCKNLVKKAEEALPSLVEICKALAGSLGMEEVGVGPVKDISVAIKKAENRYQGDVLKVTDFCRALIVVKDFPTLLALLELARDSFGPLIRRVKLSTLKSDHDPLPGGYRDCKMNVELKDHICEIQIHVWPLWVVCGVEGFRHYRHCMEYKTDSFNDPYDALVNLDRKSLAELIVMAEETVAGMPIDNLDWYHEDYLLDYFAEVGLFLDHDLPEWAETTLRHLIRLRSISADIGPEHEETLYLYRYLETSLRQQKKEDEADEIAEKVKSIELSKRNETEEESKGLWNALELVMDPNKKEREEESRLKREVKQSKRAWRKIRERRFKFLDSNYDSSVGS